MRMPIREQIGIILIAAVMSFIVTSLAINLNPGEGIQRLGYDLPAAAYSQYPGEASNRFRVSLIPRKDLEGIEIHFFWLGSRSIPNLTSTVPSPKSERIDALLAMMDPWPLEDVLIETEIEFNDSTAILQMYDFSSIFRVTGVGMVDSPTCFAFIIGSDQSILKYFEGSADFFPFPDKTISSLRFSRKADTRVFQGWRGTGLEKAPSYGTWIVNRTEKDELLEVTVLLNEDARLYIGKNWGANSEIMQFSMLIVDGERYDTWIEFMQ